MARPLTSGCWQKPRPVCHRRIETLHISGIYQQQAFLGLLPTDEGYRLAREAEEKALAIDPEFALGHASLASISLQYDDDLPRVARHLERTLALQPADIGVLGGAVYLLAGLGRIDEAVDIQEFIVARDPMSSGAHLDMSWIYNVVRRADEAIASADAAIKLSPDTIAAHFQMGVAMLQKGNNSAALAAMLAEPDEGWRLTGLALVYHALGQASASDAALAELIRKHDRAWSSTVARAYAFRGDPDHAFEWLARAVAHHDSGVVNFVNEPLLASLHNDPRWLPFLRTIGKTPEQLAAIPFAVKQPR